MKFLISLVFLMGFNADARWYCSGPCQLDTDGQGISNISTEGYGKTLNEALKNAQNQCYNHNGAGVSAIPFISSSNCRDLGPFEYKIIFRNNCGKFGSPVHTAISYLDKNGVWKYDGYWTLNFQKTAFVAVTKNRTFYIHGHTNNSAQVWGKNFGPWKIRGEDQMFNEHTIPQGTEYGEYTFNFNCN